MNATATFEITGWDGGQWGFVVPGSGTGALAGLRGDARMDHGRIALDYELT